MFHVDADGTFVEGGLFCVGSGSAVAYSVLDSVERLESLPKDKQSH